MLPSPATPTTPTLDNRCMLLTLKPSDHVALAKWKHFQRFLSVRSPPKNSSLHLLAAGRVPDPLSLSLSLSLCSTHHYLSPSLQYPSLTLSLSIFPETLVVWSPFWILLPEGCEKQTLEEEARTNSRLVKNLTKNEVLVKFGRSNLAASCFVILCYDLAPVSHLWAQIRWCHNHSVLGLFLQRVFHVQMQWEKWASAETASSETRPELWQISFAFLVSCSSRNDSLHERRAQLRGASERSVVPVASRVQHLDFV